HAKRSDRLLWLNERASDIVIAHQPEAKRQATLSRITHCRRHARIGHRYDDIGGGGLLDRQTLSHLVTRSIYRLAEDDRIGSRKLNVLKDAHRGLLLRERMRRA